MKVFFVCFFVLQLPSTATMPQTHLSGSVGKMLCLSTLILAALYPTMPSSTSEQEQKKASHSLQPPCSMIWSRKSSAETNLHLVFGPKTLDWVNTPNTQKWDHFKELDRCHTTPSKTLSRRDLVSCEKIFRWSSAPVAVSNSLQINA